MAASSEGIVFHFESTIRGPHKLYIQCSTWTPTTEETLEVVSVSQVTNFSSIDSTLFCLACLGFDSIINSYTINQSIINSSQVRMRSQQLLCAYFFDDH